jgi:hypothetical protein
MNNLVPVGSPPSPGTLLPVAIDYPAAGPAPDGARTG